MKRLFKNENNEVRSGWKIAGAIGLETILEFMFMAIVGIMAGIYAVRTSQERSIDQVEIAGKINNFFQNSPYGLLISQAVGIACVFIAIYIFLKFVDKKRFSDIGLVYRKKEFSKFIFGLILGIISISLIFFILLITGNISISNIFEPNFSTAAIISLITFIIVGIKEELLSRGYCITALNAMKKPWLSVIISSVIFSAMHLLNPNVKILGLINIILVGILFGYMYIKTNNLWMSIGYHITWNYFQGVVYGFHVSGLNIKGIFDCNVLKDNILTGGSFGPEAGILTTIVVIIGLLIIRKLPSKGN